MERGMENEVSHENVEVFYEESPRGTFGGMELLKEWLGDEPFALTNGDELKEVDLKGLQEFHDGHEGVGPIWMVEVPNAHEYGVPILNENKITEFLEKPENPPSNFINSGLYIFDPVVFDY